MDVIFYDFEFNRLRDFPKPISAHIEKCYCGFGCAELHFDISEHNVLQLLENNEYLFFVMGNNSAIVTGWQIGEDIAVYGRTPEWLLTRRGVEPFSVINETAEAVARAAVESVPDFVALDAVSNVGDEMDYSTDVVRPLYDVVREILRMQSLGFEVLPDIAEKRFGFRVYEGNENLNMFSNSNRTAYNLEYSVEKQDMATGSGWYERRYENKGGWDAKANTPVLSNNLSSNAYTFYKITSEDYNSNGNRIMVFGLWCRKDMYLYCDNLQGIWKISETKPDTIWLYIDESSKTGLQKWDAVLKGIKTTDEAKAEILQRARRNDVSCEAYRMEYGKDYHLGDITRVQLEFGDFKKTEKKRVTSVNIFYDVDKSGVIPILNSLEE